MESTPGWGALKHLVTIHKADFQKWFIFSSKWSYNILNRGELTEGLATHKSKTLNSESCLIKDFVKINKTRLVGNKVVNRLRV